MTEQHPNVERYLRTIRAFNDNDVATAGRERLVCTYLLKRQVARPL